MKLLTRIEDMVKKCWVPSHSKSLVFPTEIKKDEVLIEVVAVGTIGSNVPEVGGFVCECSGTVAAIGRSVKKWKVGDEVCAIFNGGVYAKQVAVPATHVLRRPKNISLENSASLPHEICSIWLALFKNQVDRRIVPLPQVPIILIYDGASDIGIMAIQIAKYKGMRVIVAEGSHAAIEFCKKLGADIGINYTSEDYVAVVREITRGKGVDFVLGHEFSRRHLDCIGFGGKLIFIDLHGTEMAVFGLSGFTMSCASFQVINLRTRSVDCKSSVVAEVERELWPAIEQGRIKPVIKSCIDVTEAKNAQEILREKETVGKILLRL